MTPPYPPDNPGTVYLADYGRHSRLVLQVDQDLMLEYSFGDWRYFAAGERSLWRGLVALATPSRSGLGRRPLPFVGDVKTFNRLTGAKRSARLEVEQEKLNALLAELEKRYQENINTEIQSAEGGLAFVHDDLSYHLFHNSNHQTAEWLRTLGCEVRGSPILSNFQVQERVNQAN